MTRRALLVGAGGFGGVWVNDFLPRVRDVLDVIAIADINPGTVTRAGDALGIPVSRQFTDPLAMISSVNAECCIIAIQPQFRTPIIEAATARGLHILCEKPLGASIEQVNEIVRMVNRAEIKLAVIQNYRDTARIHAFQAALPAIGALNTLDCRMAVGYTIETAGGAFRYQAPNAMIYEGAVHHIDQVRHVTGGNAAWVQGVQWNQPWSTFPNNPCLHLTLGMQNGTIVTVEMSHIEFGTQQGWYQERYSAHGQTGTLELAGNELILTRGENGVTESREVHHWQPEEKPGHEIQIRRFCDWITGGPTPPTSMDDNLQTMAIVLAAIEATQSGHTVDVQNVYQQLLGKEA